MEEFWKRNGCGEPFKCDSVSDEVGFWEVEFVTVVVF